MAVRDTDKIVEDVNARIPWRNKAICFWQDIPPNDPEIVSSVVDDQVRHSAYLCLELGADGRDEYLTVPLTQEQRDDLLFTTRLNAHSAHVMAGVNYNLLHKTRRLWWAVLGLSALNTILLILLLS